MAIDMSRDDALHTQLNDLVIGYGKALLVGASIYAVNAYSSADNYIYKDDLAAKAGIDAVNAYTSEGPPEKVIPEIAEQIEADIVIVGTAARDGTKAAMIGNTAEKILDAIAINILTVNVS